MQLGLQLIQRGQPKKQAVAVLRQEVGPLAPAPPVKPSRHRPGPCSHLLLHPMAPPPCSTPEATCSWHLSLAVPWKLRWGRSSSPLPPARQRALHARRRPLTQPQPLGAHSPYARRSSRPGAHPPSPWSIAPRGAAPGAAARCTARSAGREAPTEEPSRGGSWTHREVQPRRGKRLLMPC